MNDDNDKKPRGGKPGGFRKDGPKRDFRKDGKPAFGKKPGGKPAFGKKPGGKPAFGDKPSGKRPFAKRTDTPGAANDDRPRRDFRRDDRPRAEVEARPERSGKPFRAGPRPDRKPFEKRERVDGERKPYTPRADAPSGGYAGRPKRDFKRDDRPREGSEARAERGDRPFGKGPRPDGKPFEKRERPAGERKPYAPRPDGERKPYAARAEAERKPYAPRPGRAEREATTDRPQRRERPAGGDDRGPRPDFKPRSFGSKSHGGDQKRSYGMKSHDAERKSVRRTPVDSTEPGERIAKRLARAGIASRRDAEELIAAGRVRVNGEVLSSPAFNVMPNDEILLDGTLIPAIERTRLFLFHKPAGVVTTNRDPEGRKTVFDVLPADLPRLMTIGRLDINTEGLLLLTNDGGLSRVLELPATGWLRRYRVRVHGKVEEKALADLKDGIAVDGVFYGAIEASLDREQGSNAWLTIGLREGKNREVKNILGALGLDVNRLIRISYGPFQLGELPEGHVLEIKGRMLRDQLGERLIEESGANFEADIVKPFSNKPVRRTRDVEPERDDKPTAERPLKIGEGGLIKNRKRRENSRDEALGKLSTRPDRGGSFERPKLERGERPERSGKFGERPDRFAKFAPKPGTDPSGLKPRGGKKEREQRPFEPPKTRNTNVWMAPGARPQGKKTETSKPAASRPGAVGRGERPRPAGKGRGPRKER